MAAPPTTLIEEESHHSTQQTLWTTLPQAVQCELLQALSAMLIAALVAPSKEVSDD